MKITKQELTIEAGRWSDGTFHLSVRDHESSQMIVDLEMNADAWLHLTGGASLTLRGWVVPRELRDRIGKRMENERYEVPREIMSDEDRWRPGEKAPDSVYKWAARTCEADGWDAWDDPRRTNRGTWDVVFRRWVDPE